MLAGDPWPALLNPAVLGTQFWAFHHYTGLPKDSSIEMNPKVTHTTCHVALSTSVPWRCLLHEISCQAAVEPAALDIPPLLRFCFLAALAAVLTAPRRS